jgi:hypothetical protein
MQADSLDDNIADVVAEVRSGAIDPKQGRVIIAAHQWRAAHLNATQAATQAAVRAGYSKKTAQIIGSENL